MKLVKLNTEHSTVPTDALEKIIHQLGPVTEQLKHAAADQTYSSPYAFMHTPCDTITIEAIERFSYIKDQAPDIIILIGIGGSNLATMAILQALYGPLKLDQISPKLYTADTVNQRLTHDLLEQTKAWLEEKKNILLLITSKSGSTLETLVNAALFIDLMREHRTDYKQWMIILSENSSPLHTYATQETIPFMPVPATVPGRYSVFTATHLLPLYLMNVDIKGLCIGAELDVLEQAARNAAILYYLWNQGVAIHDLFVFDPYLESLGKWYRQLLGESIGKRTNLSGNKVEIGITPTVSVGSTDLHSVGQLYLAGPHNRLITFMYNAPGKNHDHLRGTYDFLPYYAQHKTVNDIEHAIITGITEAFNNEQRPYITMKFEQNIPESLGEFLYSMMAQMVYLGALFNINPFDQPEVELYKTLTKRCLEHE